MWLSDVWLDQLFVIRSRRPWFFLIVSQIPPAGQPGHVLMMKQKMFTHLPIYLVGLLCARHCNKELEI